MFNDGNSMSMFAGDLSSAGRRERMDRKRASQGALTGKVGGSYAAQEAQPGMPPQGYTPSNAGSARGKEIAGKIGSTSFRSVNPITGEEFGVQQPIRNTRAQNHSSRNPITGEGYAPDRQATPTSISGREEGGRGGRNSNPNNPHAADGRLFNVRSTANAHVYEVEVKCEFPIVDMSLNRKRRSITWVCEVGETGEVQKSSVEIPTKYDLDDVKMLNDEFESGKCKIHVPISTGGGIF